MTQEDVVRMAREAGVFEVSYPHPAGNMVEVERFAALVAAAEREACAEICDRLERRYGECPDVEPWAQGFKKGASVSAAKIRARGQK